MTPEIDGLVDEAILAGQRRWPQMSRVVASGFADHVRRIKPSAPDLQVCGSDLFLAYACGQGDEAALRILEKEHWPLLDHHLAGLAVPDDDRRDIFQELMIHLCSGPNPRLLGYTGRAPLHFWLKVCATRAAYRAKRQRGTNRMCDDQAALTALVDAAPSPEQNALSATVQPIIQAALRTAYACLSPRNLTLVRLFFLDGLNIDAIGRIYSVHRATVARWITVIRQEILSTVEQEIKEALGAQTADVHGLLAAVRSQVHFSLQRAASQSGRDRLTAPSRGG